MVFNKTWKSLLFLILYFLSRSFDKTPHEQKNDRIYEMFAITITQLTVSRKMATIFNR